MTATVQGNEYRLFTPWRVLGWGGAVALLAVPAVLGWPWPPFAFVAFGVMVAIVGGMIELAVRKARTPAHAIAAAIALVTGFVLQWMGRVGASEHIENMIYVVVVLIALGGAFGARFRAEGLVWAMFFTAGFQLAIALGGFAVGWVFNDDRGPVAQLIFNAGLALPWVLAGILFRAKVPSVG